MHVRPRLVRPVHARPVHARPVRGVPAPVAVALAAVLGAGAVTSATGGPARAAELAASPFRYVQSAVNLPPGAPGAGGFAGAVSFRRVVGGATSVSVFLSRSTVVACPDGEGTASTTVRTRDDEATDPGPVVLDADRLLRTARGHAVVDLVVEESPGCGAPEASVVLPAQVVSVHVTGTSERFRSGISGSVVSSAGGTRSSTEDLSRDGHGTASVGALLDDAAGAAFLKYAVERLLVWGDPPQAPANTAPPGGVGATGAASATGEPPGGLGVVFQDVGVTATATAEPGVATVGAVAETHTVVVCPAGGTALLVEVVEGAGPASLVVDRRLAAATASGTVGATRTVLDGCAPDAGPTTVAVRVPVALSLTASGPPVRVRDTRFHRVRGPDDQRTETSYLARDAVGTVTVGERSAATGLASISRARG